jgi:hypothetical protein
MVFAFYIVLLVFNLAVGFLNIAADVSPYFIAINFFAAGFVAASAMVTFLNR